MLTALCSSLCKVSGQPQPVWTNLHSSCKPVLVASKEQPTCKPSGDMFEHLCMDQAPHPSFLNPCLSKSLVLCEAVSKQAHGHCSRGTALPFCRLTSIMLHAWYVAGRLGCRGGPYPPWLIVQPAQQTQVCDSSSGSSSNRTTVSSIWQS